MINKATTEISVKVKNKEPDARSFWMFNCVPALTQKIRIKKVPIASCVGMSRRAFQKLPMIASVVMQSTTPREPAFPVRAIVIPALITTHKILAPILCPPCTSFCLSVDGLPSASVNSSVV